MNRRHRSAVVSVAVLAALLAATTACRRPQPGPGSTTTSAPATTTTEPTTTTTAPPGPEAHTKKLRYGPFTVPNVNAPGVTPFEAFLPVLGVTLDKGTLWNQPATNIEKPCEDCLITGMKAGLEFADGTPANIDKGLWLHHMVLLARGTAAHPKQDATCRDARFSMPHIAVGGSGADTERFFASGNERTPLDFTTVGRYGYRVNEGDSFHLLVELMNLTPEDASLHLTVEYTYLEGSPEGYTPVRPVWLDAAQCGTSEVPAQEGSYTITSRPWTATFDGKLVGGVGHIHDGGTHLTFERNGNVFCESRAAYGTSPEYVEPSGGDDGHGHGHGHGGAHLSEMSLCEPGEPLRTGDTLTIAGHYDDSQYPQMVHDGRLHSVMAIGVLYYEP